MNLSKNVQIRTALDHAEGNADRNGATFDMQGFEGVMMVVKFGDIATGAETNIHAESGTDSTPSDAADLTGTSITVEDDDDNQIFIIDLYRPRERYVRVVVDKDGSNNTEEMAFYIGYSSRKGPTVMTLADEVTYELHVSPAEGTA
jgi:hypothetical protein